MKFSTRSSHSQLHRRLELERVELPPLNAFFLRAESVFNLATAIETSGYIGAREDVYQRPLHEQSHGESFLDIAVNRLGPRGLYLFDEPEAALSVRGQLALMRRMHELVAGALAVRRRDALADPARLPRRDDPRAERGRDPRKSPSTRRSRSS